MSKRNHHTEQPLYWFGILEIAREKGDRDGIQAAKANLHRLGISVQYYDDLLANSPELQAEVRAWALTKPDDVGGGQL